MVPPGRLYPLSLLLLFALLLLPLGRTAAQPAAPAEDCRVLVKFGEGTGPDSARALLLENGLQPLHLIPHIDVWVAGCPPAAAQDLTAERLAARSEVLWAEPDAEVRAMEIIPNDPYFLLQQDNLRQINMPAAWVISTGSPRPVAVIDTAVDLEHSDLQTKIWTNLGEIPANGLDDDGNGYIDDLVGWDFYAGDSNPDLDPSGDSSHGTQVAGVIAAATNNGAGIAGISWASQVMVLRVLGPAQTGYYSSVAEALIYAVDNGARVMNLSLGGPEDQSRTLDNAVAYVVAQDGLPVASSGNSGVLGVLYPAALPGVLGVAAVDAADLPASFSNYGDEVDIAAPGVNIFTTAITGYSAFSGTSAAAPHASGAAALVWALRPEWSAEQVAQTLMNNAEDVWIPGWDSKTGWGRLDAYRAVQAAQNPTIIYVPTIYWQKVGEAFFLPFVAGRSSSGG